MACDIEYDVELLGPKVRSGRNLYTSVTQSVPMLELLIDLGVTWTTKDYSKMLKHCTAEDCLESAQWARERGGAWPKRVYCSKQQWDAAVPLGRPRIVWPANIRAWALAAGCDTIVSGCDNRT